MSFQKGNTYGKANAGHTRGKGNTYRRNWNLPQPFISPGHSELIALWWSRNEKGYYFRIFKQRDGKRRAKRLSRIIMDKNLRAVGRELMPHMDVDHVDGDPRNNLDNNLRDVPHALNMQNRKFNPKHPFRGTWLDKKTGKWWARFQMNYKYHIIGPFKTQLEADSANKAQRKSLGCLDSSPITPLAARAKSGAHGRLCIQRG